MEINESEKELQQKISDGIPTEPSADARAYRAVFSALKKEPAFKLPDSFAQQVAALALQSADLKENFKEKGWFALGMLALLGAFIFAVTLVDFSKFNFAPGVGVFTFLSSNAGLVIFGLIFVIGLHLLEKKLLRPSK
jgi:hypothetical protein